MGEPLLYDFKGLVTAPGRLARAEASCIDTKNVVFPAPGIVEKRRGWRRLAAVTGGTPWKVFSTKEWGTSVIPIYLISVGLTAGGQSLQFGDGINPWAAVTLPDVPGPVRSTISTRVAGAQSLRSFFLAAQDAPLRLEPDATSSLVAKYAGMPRGLVSGRNSGLSALAGTLLPDGYARAYRVTWHRYDSDGVLLSGPPTGRFVIRNQAGTTNYAAATTKDSLIGFPIPMEWGTNGTPLTTSYFWRLWASRTFNAAGGEEGDDQMYLVQQRYLSAPELVPATNTVVTSDSTPNDFLQRQQALNTNSIDFPIGELGRAQGLLNADEPPPIANEVVTWANVAWWADIRYRPQGIVTFLSTGAPSGLQDNDTVTATIGATAITLRAKLVPALATDFQLFTALATVQMNLEATAQAYAFVLNTVAYNAGVGSVGLRAYPVGLPTSMGGVVMIESLKVDSTGIGLQFVSSRTSWYQYDGSSSGFGQAGVAAEARNAACYSKPRRADSVPLINRFTAGPNNARIIRLFPFRDRLFFFTDAGTYVMSGQSFADFSLQEYALDLKLLAREAVAVCDDAVYAWCTAGIAKITDGGWEIVSTPIEPTVTAAVREALANAPDGQVAALAFAVADVVQHRVLFWYPQREVGTGDARGCPYALVHDTRTGAWSQYDMVQTTASGLVDFRSIGMTRASDGVVMLASERNGNPSEGYLYGERRDEPSSSAYSDSYSNDLSPSGPVQATLQLQYQIPNAGGAQHWQQSVLQLATNELPNQSNRPLPTSLDLTWSSESQVATQTVVPSNKVVRIEPPRAVRRGNSLAITLSSTAAEYFGLVGIAQRYLSGTPFARGKTR